MDAPKAAGSPQFAWNFSFPLLTNRFFLWDMGKVFFLSGLIGSLLLSVMLVFAGNARAIIPLTLLICGIVLSFAVLTILISLIWFGNRFHALFAINCEGAMAEVARSRDKAASRLAVVLGILSGNMAAAGTGLLAMSEEAKRISWAEVRKVNYYPDARVISIKNGWRVVVRLYCSQENYEQIAAAVKAYSGTRS